VLGQASDEVAHPLLDVTYADVLNTEIQHVIHIRVTVMDLIPTLLSDL
jgi:hypothetical protein